MGKSKFKKKRLAELEKIEEESLDISAGPFYIEIVLDSISQNEESTEKESYNRSDLISFFLYSVSLIILCFALCFEIYYGVPIYLILGSLVCIIAIADKLIKIFNKTLK